MTNQRSSIQLQSEGLPRLLRIREVMELVRKKQSAIYGAIADGSFPSPIRLGARSVAWLEEDVRSWILSRPRVKQPARGKL